MLNQKIEEMKQDMIQATQELIRFPSVHSESAKPNAPFGKAIAEALEFTLALGKRLGFRTKNLDGYCGYIEFGDGEELIGIIGHLDVVPAGEHWSYAPFEACIANGNLYGRGAIDDKGPVMASLYAMKAVMDTCQVSKRVRLILGTNEERDWECINYYQSHEEIPTMGFSPDADFPCIYAEKALLTVHLEQHYQPDISMDPIIITDIDCHQNAINVVPKQCDVTLQISSSLVIEEVMTSLQETIHSYSYSIEILPLENRQIRLISHGISAHAAHPDLGSNAISHISIVLYQLFQKYGISFELLDFFATSIGDDYTGKQLGLSQKDESGILTLNTAQATLENGKFRFGLNLRIPIHTSIQAVEEQFKHALHATSISCLFSGKKEALYLPKDHFLVKTLCHIYHEATGSTASPIAIGGATYARAFPNCISFGANFPGTKDMCHQVDEYISLSHLILASKIYAKAIWELAK